jgi:hypothetical protein
MSSNGDALKYFLYIPVWATTQQPPTSNSQSTEASSQSSSASSSMTDSVSSGSSSGVSSGASSGVSSGGESSGGGGTGGTGGGTGGTGGGSGGSGGSGGGSTNCFLFGTLVTMADGRRVPIETLQPGDAIASLQIPGLVVDVDYRAQYDWLSSWGLDGIVRRAQPVGAVRLGTHDGFVVINGRVKCTAEHPILVRRDDQWGFVSAELVEVGDALFLDGLGEEAVASVERIAGRVQTVALHVPGTNTLLVDGIWAHNDISLSALTSTSGSSSSASGTMSSTSGSTGVTASKSSGSSFTSSSGSVMPTIGSSAGTGPGLSPSQGGSTNTAG